MLISFMYGKVIYLLNFEIKTILKDKTMSSVHKIAPKSGAAKQLVVFLHGYGADGRDLIDIGRHWQTVLPDAAFISPDAPEPCGMSPMGRQWFELTMRDPDERWRGVNHAEANLLAMLDAELSNLKLNDTDLALVGFSQGTMMALHVGLRRKMSPACIVGYSGALIMPRLGTFGNTDLVKPPVLLIHGDQDEVIPVGALRASEKALVSLGISCETHISKGVGHGIDNVGLKLGGEFLAKNFR